MGTSKSLQTPAKNGFKYREQYGVIVICRDAAHQERVFNQLKDKGHHVKVVTV